VCSKHDTSEKEIRLRYTMISGIMRYPGGKTFLVNQILSILHSLLVEDSEIVEYREPFLGGGVVALNALSLLPFQSAVLNDIDMGMITAHQIIKTHANDLNSSLMNEKASIESFEKAKFIVSSHSMKLKSLDGKKEKLQMALNQIKVHQMSWDGRGLMGGPISPIDDRWNVPTFIRKINHASMIYNSLDVVFSSIDFEKIITDTSRKALIYLDPPYWEKSVSLYPHSFSILDHYRLASILKKTDQAWVLSYDNHPRIINLYSWANIKKLNEKELVITKY
jgi:DNA adenine methylase